jgi:outer membrane protein assembly factor BamB
MIVLTCCTIRGFGAWPTYHGDTGLKGVAEVQLGERLELAWRYDAGGEIYSPPVSDGERIYFTANKGRVLAVDLKGTKVWEKSFTRTNDAAQVMALRFEAPLACAAGMVFAASTKGTLYALEAKTGAEQWRYETDGIIIGSPNMVSNLVVVLDQSKGALHGLEIETGKLRWTTEAVERCDGSPGIHGGRIVFGSCLAALHVHSASGRREVDIELDDDGQIAGGVAIDGNHAFAGTRDGNLVKFDVDKGTVVWSIGQAAGPSFSTPALGKTLVVYASDDGVVRAARRKEGTLVWEFNTQGLPGSPVIAGDRVLVSADGGLYLLDLKDGTRLWSQEISDDITSPAMIGKRVVVGTDEGTVSAFRTKE